MGMSLIIAGDLHDTKVSLNGNCTNKLVDLFSTWSKVINIYVLVGNHDLFNEKSNEHVLEFLRPYCSLIDDVCYLKEVDCWAIPYQCSPEHFRDYVQHIPNVNNSNRIIAHQGIQGALMGDYAVDKSAVDPKALEGFKVISGHYHKHQTVGNVTYIGNPYTMSFGEANDGPKGFLILYDDFSFKQVPLNLRKHMVVERTPQNIYEPIKDLSVNDKLWIKLAGTQDELSKIDRNKISSSIEHEDFRLDLIYTDAKAVKPSIEKLANNVVLDKIIDDTTRADEDKVYLKTLWREILE